MRTNREMKKERSGYLLVALWTLLVVITAWPLSHVGLWLSAAIGTAWGIGRLTQWRSELAEDLKQRPFQASCSKGCGLSLAGSDSGFILRYLQEHELTCSGQHAP